jgi:hypothetical protein
MNDDRAEWTSAWKLFPRRVGYVWHAALKAPCVAADLEAAGFKIRSQITWHRQHFALSRGDYHWQHEPAWYAIRGSGHWCGDRRQATVWEIANLNPMGGTRSPFATTAACGNFRRRAKNKAQTNHYQSEKFRRNRAALSPLGNHSAATAIVRELQKRFSVRTVAAVQIALVLAALPDMTQALEWVEKSVRRTIELARVLESRSHVRCFLPRPSLRGVSVAHQLSGGRRMSAPRTRNLSPDIAVLRRDLPNPMNHLVPIGEHQVPQIDPG